jgi:plastocyanin
LEIIRELIINFNYMSKTKSLIIILALPLLLTACGQASVSPQVNQPVVPPANQNVNQPADNSNPQVNQNANVNEAVQPQTYRVSINNFQFTPQNLTVKKGDVVIWTNNDTVSHTVNSDPHPVHTDHPSLNLGLMQPGESKTFTADGVGTWGYHCHLHPNMTGSLTITQ